MSAIEQALESLIFFWIRKVIGIKEEYRTYDERKI